MHPLDPFDVFSVRLEDMSGMEKTYFIDSIYKDWDRANKISEKRMEVIYRVLLTELIKDHGH